MKIRGNAAQQTKRKQIQRHKPKMKIAAITLILLVATLQPAQAGWLSFIPEGVWWTMGYFGLDKGWKTFSNWMWPKENPTDTVYIILILMFIIMIAMAIGTWICVRRAKRSVYQKAVDEAKRYHADSVQMTVIQNRDRIAASKNNPSAEEECLFGKRN